MADPAALLRDLLQSGQYSDLTLRCQQTTFKLHRAVVCSRSKVLAAAVGGSFKEASTGEIDLSVDELPVIRAMIHYLYHGDYEEQIADEPHMLAGVSSTDAAPGIPPSNNEYLEEDHNDMTKSTHFKSSKPLSMIFQAKMYIIGDKYDISVLKEKAKIKFQEAASGIWIATELCDVVDHLWENTMDSDVALRKIIAGAASRELKTLLNCSVFTELLTRRGDFAVMILKAGVANQAQNEPLIDPFEDPLENSWGKWGTSKKKAKR